MNQVKSNHPRKAERSNFQSHFAMCIYLVMIPVILVDGRGIGYKTSYLLETNGLSADWRGFSISHRLRKGDFFILHWIEPCKVKVYIVRVNGLDGVDTAFCLMNWQGNSEDINRTW